MLLFYKGEGKCYIAVLGRLLLCQLTVLLKHRRANVMECALSTSCVT